MTLRFTMQNPLPHNGSIEVLLPPGFSFEQVGALEPSATFNLARLVVGDSNITIYQTATVDTLGLIEITLGEITPRKGTAGTSGDFTITTRRPTATGQMRVVDTAVVAPELATARLVSAKVNVTDLATGGAPLVGQEVQIEVETLNPKP